MQGTQRKERNARNATQTYILQRPIDTIYSSKKERRYTKRNGGDFCILKEKNSKFQIIKGSCFHEDEKAYKGLHDTSKVVDTINTSSLPQVHIGKKA